MKIITNDYLYDDGGRRARPDVRRDEERIQEPRDFSLRVKSHATRRTAALVGCVQKARVRAQDEDDDAKRRAGDR